MRTGRLMTLAGVVMAVSLGAVAQERFTLKREEAQTGSHIKREAATGNIPLDKPYRDFTPEQKRIVKKPYENMKENDEPPFPEKGLAELYMTMSKVHAKVHANGLVDMEVVVDPAGKPLNVLVYSSPDEKASEIMAMALMATKYKPALCSGQPCQQNFLFRAKLTPGY
ncbi:hypothetical protein [Massilia sp. erpn]|uniref:hypothetical protein n=1 Tax=Massilia sp. erpn TaxID=2738142 RepID=UPI00210573FC|nr:hypothetical protein [Massilia sp. erpn]UTY59975.1 hypothetical protein HPQ68_23970 [Massilia sp. erpn]